jgi:hypothetical protein
MIRLGEEPIRLRPSDIGLRRSTFCAWYKRYLDGRPEALEDRKPRPQDVWDQLASRGECGQSTEVNSKREV